MRGERAKGARERRDECVRAYTVRAQCEVVRARCAIYECAAKHFPPAMFARLTMLDPSIVHDADRDKPRARGTRKRGASVAREE